MRRRMAAGALLGAAGSGLTGLWWQLFRRPLPKTSGTIRVRGLEAPVSISRDRLGVPRIEARSAVDLCFGHGFCHGQDRLFQLDFYRRAASGRMAEIAGEDALASDRLMRTLGLRRAAEREAAALDGRRADYLDAYCAGIDAAAAAAPALPLEMQLLRAQADPWTRADSLVIARVIALGFSTNMEAELFRAELVRRVGPEVAERLEPRYPRGNPLVAAPYEGWSGDAVALAAQLAAAREAIGLSPQPSGSNNWAVSAERSATGAPLLAGDPHISTTIPDVWYTVELEAPGISLCGGSMPGLPGVVIGRSRRVAWSFTNVMADVQDLFVERIHEPADGGPPEYEFDGARRPVDVRLEEIRVQGRSEPELLEVRETHHGPLVSDVIGARGGDALALAWTAIRDDCFVSISVDAGSITSGAELVEAFRDYNAPCMNLVWADADGNIGYKLVGRLPLRRGGCPDLPAPGWSGDHEWDGYVPFDELPEVVNPPSGVIVTANNRIAGDDYPHHITSEYLDGYRAARIEELLAARERHTLDDFARIQCDLHSIPGVETARRLTRLTPGTARERAALGELARWDGTLGPETVAGSIYQAFTTHFAQVVSEAVIGDTGDAARWRSKSLMGFTPMVSAPWRWQARLLELWEEADPELVGGRSWDELALEALHAALDDLTERFGSDSSRWTWGRVHGAKFQHPLGQGESAVSRALDRLLSRRLAAGGGQETVSQIGYVAHEGDYTGSWAPSFRLIADLADPARTRWQHMTGQSGHPGSPLYDNLLGDWLAGRTNPVGEPAAERLELEPA